MFLFSYILINFYFAWIGDDDSNVISMLILAPRRYSNNYLIKFESLVINKIQYLSIPGKSQHPYWAIPTAKLVLRGWIFPKQVRCK